MASKYSLDQLKQALIKADSAGDEEAARIFAAEIANYPSQQKVYEDTSLEGGGFLEDALGLNQSPLPYEGEFSAARSVANMPGSFYRMGQGIMDMLGSPIETAKTIGKTLIGTGQLLYPGEQEYEKYPKAIGQHYANLLSNPGKSMQEDPVGTSLDVYAPARLTGGVLKDAARLGAKALPESLPASLYQRGAKFSTTMDAGERAKIIDTALKNKILPNQAGVDKLNSMLGDYSSRVNGLISEATASGKMIPRSDLLKHTGELFKEFGNIKPGASKNIKKLTKLINDDFADWMPGKTMLTPTEVQEWKLAAYNRVNKWGMNSSPKTSVMEAYDKATGRAAKEAIEEAVPGVAELNKPFGELLNLKKPLQQAANRISNRDLFSFTDVAGAGVGAGLGGPAGMAAGGGLMAIRHPSSSARLGMKLYGLQHPSTGLLRPKARDALLGLLQTGNIQDILGESP